MKSKNYRNWLKTAGLTALILSTPAIMQAQAKAAQAGVWRNEVGVAYISGLSDLVDAIEKNYYDLDVTEWPIGLTYRGYYLYPSGLGLGLSVGPTTILFGDVDTYILPLGAEVRYVVGGGKATALILRAGARYPIAGGDHIEGSSLGFVGGVALEFPISSERMAIGVEAAYDSSEVEVEAGWQNEDIKLCEFSLTVYLRF